MLCAFGKNTEETVLENFSINRLIGPQRTDGSYFVLKQEEFDQANRDLSDEVLSQFNISNAFFVREGTTARFNKTFAQLVDIVSERDGITPVQPTTPLPTEAEVVSNPILRRLNRAFLNINAIIMDGSQQLMDKAREIVSGRGGVQYTVTSGFNTRDGKSIGFQYDTDKLARERFDIPNLTQIGKGSDRTVFDLGDGKVLKVAHTARGMEQNIYEGDWGLKGIIPEVFERGLNYVVTENIPRLKNSDVVTVYDPESGEEVGTTTAGQMIKDLSKFTQMDFDRKTSEVQNAVNKYGFGDIFSYDVLYGDFSAIRNWGYKDGSAYHIDGGTFGGTDMITQFRGKTPLSDPEFRQIYEDSKRLKKQLGDKDKYTMFSFNTGLDVFHGSPHSFERFSASRIGSGTGEDVYGWGLYFSSEEDVARGYAVNDYVIEKHLVNKLGIVPDRYYQIPVTKRNSGKKAVIEYINNQIKSWEGLNEYQVMQWRDLLDNLKDFNSNLYKAKIGQNKNFYVVAPIVNKDGMFNVYTSDVWAEISALPRAQKDGVLDNPEFKPVNKFQTKEAAKEWANSNSELMWLDWFGRSTEAQRSIMLDKLEQVFSDPKNFKVGTKTIVLRDKYDSVKVGDRYEVRDITKNDEVVETFDNMSSAESFVLRSNILESHLTGAEIYQAITNSSSQLEASQYLNEVGFTGNKVSITGPNGDKFNYVVFDENLVTITEVVQFHRNELGEILGFAHNGKIYLNSEKITAQTTLEEAGHIWLNWSKTNRPDLFNEGLSKVKNSPYLQEVSTNNNYINEASKQGPVGSEAYNNYLLEEALAKAIADQGAKFVTETKRNSFKEWVMGMWKEIAKYFGIRDLSATEIKDMSLEDFAKRIAADLFSRQSQSQSQSQSPSTPDVSDGVIQLTPSTRQVLDEVTDEVLDAIPTQNFSIRFSDGATSMGTIEGGTARISDIKAPKNGSEVIRGTKTYERVLAQLKQQGVNTIQIVLQSADSRAAINRLVESGKLTNPRNMRGISVDKFPTTFDIPSQSPISSPGLPDLNIPEGWVSPC